jgi:hypothetical protein
MTKYETDEHVELDEELVDQFSSELETTINTVCENNPDVDPRLELLVSLGMFAAQVGIDSGFTCDEFLNLLKDLYHDSEPQKLPEVTESRKILN